MLNGNPPTTFSSLIQFMDEPMDKWCTVILDKIYEELEGPYSLHFTAREEDRTVMRIIAEAHKCCSEYVEHDFCINTSFQKRMIALNKFLNELKSTKHTITKLKSKFYIPISLKSYEEMIRQIDINNSYCNVRVETEIIDFVNIATDNDSVNFVLAKNMDFAKKAAEKAVGKYCFVICIDESSSGFHSVINNSFVFNASADNFFDIIFFCFKLFPLTMAFVECVKSVDTKALTATAHNCFKEIIAVDPIINIDVADIIEVGRSVPIRITTIPPVKTPPNITYEYGIPGIVKCFDMRVEGISEGVSNVIFFRAGEVIPICEKKFTVIKRNPITQIFLSESELLLGVSDKFGLTYSFVPENADNANQVKWVSNNTDVADITDKGKVLAKSSGKCRIMCIAEKIVSYCEITVKPYLSSIELPEEFAGESATIILGKSYTLEYTLTPDDAFDSEIEFISDDLFILNVRKNTICAKSVGKTKITIQNNTKRIVKTIDIEVVPECETVKEKKNKKGFFAWLIGLFKRKG